MTTINDNTSPILLNQTIFANSGNQLFYRVENSDGKVWYIPHDNSSIALQIYQPSSIYGKLLKSCLPVIKRFAFIHDLLGISVHRYAVQPSLSDLLRRLYQVENVEVALFCGTPSVHQKITMQITDGSNILGYCKISGKEDVQALFRHEENILKELFGYGFKNIPQCLYRGVLKDQMHIFVTTTTKTMRSKVLHQLSALHWDFLNHLHQKTKQRLPFERSDFYQVITSLKRKPVCLSVYDIRVVTSVIERIEAFYAGKQVEFSFYHSDFTPWNMIVEESELFVFDWEYAKYTFPPFLDAFHFFTQSCIFEQHKNAAEILTAYKTNKRIFEACFDDPDFSYVCYLIGVISFYGNRDKGILSSGMANNIQIWVELLRLL